MADVQISALNQAASAGNGDYFIINKGDSSTQKIAYENLTSGINGFAPIFHNFGYTTPLVEIRGWDKGGDGNIFGSVSPISVQMPAGANAAVIICSYTCRGYNPNPVSVPGTSYCYHGHSIRLSGGNVTVIDGGESNAVVFGTILHFYQHQTPNVDQWKLDAVGDWREKTKFCTATFTEGSTVTFTAQGTRKGTKQMIVNFSAGRFIVLPYNTNNLTAFEADQIASLTANGDEDSYVPGDFDEARIEYEKSIVLKERSTMLIRHGDDALRYDTGLNDTQKQNITQGIQDIFALKRDPNKDYQTMFDELDVIQQMMIDNEVAFTYGWQTNSSNFKSF